MLTLRLLGGLEIARDGAPVRLPPSRKTRALLAYLVLSGRPQRRERLVSLLWQVPDDPRGALRWSLSKLREALDEPLARRIVADRDSIAFEPAGAHVDLLALQEAAARGFETLDGAALEALAAEVRGEPLEGLELPDLHDYHAWFVHEREQARRLHARLLRALAERPAGTREASLGWARRLVEYEPYDAEAHALLLRLLFAAGLRREAEAQARLALRLLAESDARAADGLRRLWDGLRTQPSAPALAGPEAAVAVSAGIPAAEAPAAVEASQQAHALLSRPAVAVLAFDNLGGDPEQDYFAEGMADDLITALSAWRWFPVIARTSSFAFRGRGLDPATLGRELGARYLVQGSVRRAGGRVRVTAQLVDAASGLQLWAERYDGELGDVFALQDELTEQIVARIEPELARAESQRAERKAPQNLDVWDLNLRALARVHRGSATDLQEANRLLRESLRLDAEWSHTWAALAYTHYHEALHGWTHDPVATTQAVVEAAQRAVALDDGNWLGHAFLGISVLWNRRDFETAGAEVRKAVALNPTAALARQFSGCVLSFDGHPAEAIPHLAAAMRLNPASEAGTLLLADMALAHLLSGAYEEAAYHARRAIAHFSDNVRAWQRLAAALGQLGQRDEARHALAELEARQGPLTPWYVDATYPFRFAEHRDVLWEGLAKAGWKPAQDPG